MVARRPHDSTAFTQGLVFEKGFLFESTGQYGSSSLRKVHLDSGIVVARRDLPKEYFGEGMTIFQGRIYQLTWQSHKGFIYDAGSLEPLGEFKYEGEGWGLTHDDKSLILSDGTEEIRFINPSNFKVLKRIHIHDAEGRSVRDINELEFVRDEIWANVWHMSRIARIHPRSGEILGWIDLDGLGLPNIPANAENVLNGIAYEKETDRLFVTGKKWPHVYEIRIDNTFKGDSSWLRLPASYSVTRSLKGVNTSREVYLRASQEALRMESLERGAKTVLIIRKDLQLAYSLLPQSQSYLEMAWTDRMGGTEIWEHPGASIDLQGNEVLEGTDCKRYKIILGKSEYQLWVDATTKLPVLQRNPDQTRLKWESFKTEPQPQAFFEPPPNYKKLGTRHSSSCEGCPFCNSGFSLRGLGGMPGKEGGASKDSPLKETYVP